jgi:hypothetical protein
MQTSVKVTLPKVSDKTLKEMAKFFVKTSIPRILEENKKEK